MGRPKKKEASAVHIVGVRFSPRTFKMLQNKANKEKLAVGTMLRRMFEFAIEAEVKNVG